MANSTVWLLTFEDRDDPSNNSTYVWVSEYAARKQACANILEQISHDWDLKDPDVKSVAEEVNNHVMAGSFREAMTLFADTEAEKDYGCYWWAHAEGVSELSDAEEPAILIFAEPDEEDEDLEEEEDEEEPYQATDAGATCRGPCGQTNEYAYANKKDGTYVCHSCKMMSQVFGGKIA